MTPKITFWNGDPNNGGKQIAGEVTHNEDGTISFQSHQNGTYSEIYLVDEDGNPIGNYPLGG